MELRPPDLLTAGPPPDTAAEQDELRAELVRLYGQLERACEYGQSLWTCLDEARHYLLQEVAGGEQGDFALLGQQHDWQRWGEVFAAMSTTLTGAGGDVGFGRSEASLVARAHGTHITLH